MKQKIIPLSAATLCLFGLAVAPLTVAHADGGETDANPQASVVIDGSQNGKSGIKIVKHKLDETMKPGTGLETQVSSDTLAGAKFKLQKVKTINNVDISKLDLTKNADILKLASLVDKNGQPTGDVTYEDAATESDLTGDDGIVNFSNLAFGLYYITETVSPKGASPAVPFYVTLPLWTEANKQYTYNPVLYPKNAIATAVKTVNDAGLTGDKTPLAYTVTTTVNKHITEPGGADSNIQKYVIQDQIDKRVVLGDITVVAKATTGDAPELKAGDDYTLSKENNLVKIEFTTAGLAKLNQIAGSASTLTTTINGTLQSKGDIKDITNQATFIPNQDPQWDNGGIPSDTVTTELGKISVKKVDAADKTKVLAGAKFKLLDENNKQVEFYTSQAEDATPVTEVTTGDDGMAMIYGVRVSDWENNQKTTQTRTYKLVEVESPAGYGKLPEPVEVTLAMQDGTDGSNVDIQVENPKQNLWFKLPQTGAAGIAILVTLGAVAVTAGGVLTLARRGKSDKAAEIVEKVEGQASKLVE